MRPGAAYGLGPISIRGVIGRAALLAAVGLAACGLPATSAQAADGGSVRLRVMTFNIFYGGDELDLRTGDWCALRRGCSATFEQVIRTIRA
jgi:hypothetical protein